MADPAHEAADRAVEEVMAEVRETYLQAQMDAQEALSAYLARFEREDAAKRKLVEAGELSEADYRSWRASKVLAGKRYASLLDQVAWGYEHANEVAVAALEGRLPEVYAENANFAAYSVCEATGMAVPFDMMSADAVQQAIANGENLFPVPSVNAAKDVAWNRRLMASQLAQGLLLGESMPKVAARIRNVTDSNWASALRTARTTVTAAENAGRVSSYKRAQGLGIDLRQEWVATLDGRTRHSHRQLDGEKVKVGEKFSNGCRYPGDPEAPYAETMNCRCTLVGAVDGFGTDDARRWSRLPEGMTYEQWKAEGAKVAAAETERKKRGARVERISSDAKYAVNEGKVHSKEYEAAISAAVGSVASGRVYATVKTMLRHRGGTNGEDLYAIDIGNGRTVTSCVTSKLASRVVPGKTFEAKVEKAVSGGARVALVHNHPASSMPSASDLASLAEKGCELGVIAAHDGSIFTFCKVAEPLPGYNVSDEELLMLCRTWKQKGESATFEAIERNFGFKIERVI